MPLIENYQVHKIPDVVVSEKDIPDAKEKKSPLDKEDVQERLKRVKEWHKSATSTLEASRTESATDHNYYDNEQWTEEERAILEERGQQAVVFNQIATTVDWILGTEKRQRVDWHVLPRGKEDTQGAEAKTKLLKYISDVNTVPYQRSLAFEDAAKGGVGWIEVSINNDPTQEQVTVQYEDWRNIWYDPLAKRYDLKDARFIFRAKWVDLDTAMVMWPERKMAIKASAYSDRDYKENEDYELNLHELGEDPDVLSDRSRVRLVECWYRVPARVKVMHGAELGTLDGVEFDATDESHVYLYDNGYATVTDSMQFRMRQMIYTGEVVLQDDWSPYNHNRFPFIPIFAKRKKKDGTPYGPIRNMRSPQDDLNKRHSKALFILSTNKIIADDNATDDWENLQQEAARPDGVVRKRPNSHLEIVNETALAEAHVRLMQQDSIYIQDAGGVTNENLGRDTNAISGRAIEAKQDQGKTVSIKLFDNHRHAFQLMGQIILSLIEQYYTEEQYIRILEHPKAHPEWVAINQTQPDGSILNDLTASKADFIVSETDFSESLRQSMFETLTEMMTRIDPQISMQLLDIVMDLSDMPGKESIIRRIREITGVDDPDADPDDPEVQARQEAKQQAEEEQAEMERQKLLAEVEKAQADVEAARADTEKTLYEAQKIRYQAIYELAKIDTEKAKQEATKAGIAFDEIKLRIERAKALNDIETGQASREVMKKSQAQQGGQYHERGLKSNNQKKRWESRDKEE